MKPGSVSTFALPGRRLRAVWFRVLAVLVGVVPFVVCEAVLMAIDVGRPEIHDDPFLGFSRLNPLFVLDETGRRYEIPPAHYKFFRRDWFAARKPAGEFRIFCLGGSSVQGHPFSVETSFTTWLRISLEAADPSRTWKVVNCGGVSYATYRLAPMMEELLHYEPDLFIVYEGHNEFLEDRSYDHLKRIPRIVRRPLEMLARLRTFNVLRSGFDRLAGRSAADVTEARDMLGPEVQAMLDYKGGLEAYRRDDAWRQDVIDHFAFNLRRMVRLADEAGVPIMLVNPVSNLDTPPFKSEHRADLTAAERRQFDALWDAARQSYGKRLPAAVELLREAIAVDDQHAGIHYALAKCYQQLGRMAEAREEFVLAKDMDICPLRALGAMNRIVLDVARASDKPVIDLMALFSRRSPDGIPGGDWLVDHVHPSIAGHQLIADVMADELVRLGYLRPVPTWRAERDRRYCEHLASLDEFYYLKAQQRLKNLQLWAEGRGNIDWPAGTRVNGRLETLDKDREAE